MQCTPGKDLWLHRIYRQQVVRRAKTDDQYCVIARTTGHAHVVLLQELLRIVVAVNVNLRESVEDSRVLATGLHAGFQPGQDELETVASLDLVHQLVDGEVTRHRGKQALDGRLVTVDIE